MRPLCHTRIVGLISGQHLLAWPQRYRRVQGLAGIDVQYTARGLFYPACAGFTETTRAPNELVHALGARRSSAAGANVGAAEANAGI